MGLSANCSNDWRLFVDSLKRSLKCVLLHSITQDGSLPIGHFVTQEENYENIKVVLERLKYCVHKWLINDKCGFKNGKFPIRATRKSYQISVIFVLLG